ncbi:hypothetical protein BDAP_001800 [Binucleata daphniae]
MDNNTLVRTNLDDKILEFTEFFDNIDCDDKNYTNMFRTPFFDNDCNPLRRIERVNPNCGEPDTKPLKSRLLAIKFMLNKECLKLDDQLQKTNDLDRESYVKDKDTKEPESWHTIKKMYCIDKLYNCDRRFFTFCSKTISQFFGRYVEMFCNENAKETTDNQKLTNNKKSCCSLAAKKFQNVVIDEKTIKEISFRKANHNACKNISESAVVLPDAYYLHGRNDIYKINNDELYYDNHKHCYNETQEVEYISEEQNTYIKDKHEEKIKDQNDESLETYEITETGGLIDTPITVGEQENSYKNTSNDRYESNEKEISYDYILNYTEIKETKGNDDRQENDEIEESYEKEETNEIDENKSDDKKADVSNKNNAMKITMNRVMANGIVMALMISRLMSSMIR